MVLSLVQKLFQYAAFLFGILGTKISDSVGIAKKQTCNFQIPQEKGLDIII